MRRFAALVLACLGLLSCAHREAGVPPAPPKPPAVNQLLVGSWKYEVAGTGCVETYAIHADGTMEVSSGAQIAESAIEVSLVASARGYLAWNERITKDNGGADCLGRISTVGNAASRFVLLHRSKREFLLCLSEYLESCIGPYLRQGQDA